VFNFSRKAENTEQPMKIDEPPQPIPQAPERQPIARGMDLELSPGRHLRTYDPNQVANAKAEYEQAKENLKNLKNAQPRSEDQAELECEAAELMRKSKKQVEYDEVLKLTDFDD
jgi:hypothetical protein